MNCTELDLIFMLTGLESDVIRSLDYRTFCMEWMLNKLQCTDFSFASIVFQKICVMALDMILKLLGFFIRC